jgi:aspartyl-tRNA(Asn)/glutamyl-tRNA(Gln) amidotransferase subunit B
VTEPVIHDAKTAGAFAKELQLLLKTLKISGAQMERGEMRVEANISVSKTDTLGTKVEVKNLNSFRSVEGAIEFEVARQIALLESGETVAQETRGWDEVKLRTFTQRSKETAKDYRYFPDPDLPKIDTSAHPYFSAARLPELPSEKRLKYTNLGLTSEQTEQIIASPELDNYLAAVVSGSKNNPDIVRLTANYLISDITALRLAGRTLSLAAENLYKLMELVNEGTINSRVAKDILSEIIDADTDPALLAKERGLLQSSDPAALAPIINAILSSHPAVVAEYKAGKATALQFLVGQGMKQSRGTANPGLLADLLRQAIAEKS